jgi:AraC-like DNA-binding protein
LNETAIRVACHDVDMGQWSANWVPDSAWLAPGYAEWAPPAALRGVVACLWAGAAVSGPEPSTLVLPDGCSDLIWEQGTGGYVAGPDTGPVRMMTEPGRVVVGVRFRPAAGGRALGLPLSELRDQRVPLGDVLPPGRHVAARLPATLPPAEAAARMLDIAGRMIADSEPDPALTRVAALLRDPGARTEDVAGQVGLSERQLRRRCHAAAGYGPKTLQRILRFQHFVQLLDAAPLGATGRPLDLDAAPPGTTGRPLDLAAVAAATGYADQPHLTRECAAFSGLTPTELTRIRRPAWPTEPLAGEAA